MKLVAPVPKDLFELGLRGKWFEELRKAVNSTIFIPSSSKSSAYTTTVLDSGTVIYVSGGATITLNDTPEDGEHYWICNEDSSLSSSIQGGSNTIQGSSSQTLPKLSTYHLHYKSGNWSAL